MLLCAMADGRLGVLITTHDRVDDARINMEIIRSLWRDSSVYSSVAIVHAHNGPREIDRYHADLLVRQPNEATHFRGAAALIDQGLRALNLHFPDIRYAVVLTADAWLYKPSWLDELLCKLLKESYTLASARWRIEDFANRLFPSGPSLPSELLPTDGLATDCFVVDVQWAVKWGMSPLAYGQFLDKYEDLLNYSQEMPFLERYFAGKFLAAVRRQMVETRSTKDPWGSSGPRQARRLLLEMPRDIDPQAQGLPPTGSKRPRQPHKGHWPEMGLMTSESPGQKRTLLRAHATVSGATADRLRGSEDLSWYNRASD